VFASLEKKNWQIKSDEMGITKLSRSLDWYPKIPAADKPSRMFCKEVSKFFKDACAFRVPASKKARKSLVSKLQKRLACICKKKALVHPKSETLSKRLLPASSEYPRLFAFMTLGGPPSNNHTERATRPMVIFWKICLGTRSETGSENLSIFGSLTQTAALQGAALIDVFKALFADSPSNPQDAIFGPPPELNYYAEKQKLLLQLAKSRRSGRSQLPIPRVFAKEEIMWWIIGYEKDLAALGENW